MNKMCLKCKRHAYINKQAHSESIQVSKHKLVANAISNLSRVICLYVMFLHQQSKL